jgi:hypothetical protein
MPARSPPAGFDHRAHVRVAWLCLRADRLEAGTARMTDGLRAITIAAGVPEKLNLALTADWCARVQQAIDRSPGTADFEAFAAQAPELFPTRDR